MVTLRYEWSIAVLSILLYELVCTVTPAPIEAPMFLFPELPRWAVLITIAIGKGCGTYLFFIIVHNLKRTRVLARIGEARSRVPIWNKLSRWSKGIVDSYGLLGFLLIQSIPGLPMRSAVYAASLLGINAIKFSVAAAIGAVVRCLIIYGSYRGLRSLLQ